MMKIKVLAYYFLFFLMACVCFSYVLFPGEKVAHKFIYILEHQPVISKAKLENATLSFPKGDKLERLVLKVGNNLKLIPENTSLSPGLISMVGKEKKIRFSADIFDGQVKGVFRLLSFDQPQVNSFELAATELKINNLIYGTSQAELDVSLVLDGECELARDEKNLISGEGHASITPMAIVLKNSLLNRLGFPKLLFSQTEVEFTIKQDQIRVSKFLASGTTLNIKMSGLIAINHQRYGDSALNLKGTILPDSAYISRFANLSNVRKRVKNITKKGIPFKIRGPLKSPQMTL